MSRMEKTVMWSDLMSTVSRRTAPVLLLVVVTTLAACSSAADPDAAVGPGAGAGDPTAVGDDAQTIRLYTTVTQDTVDAVIEAWGSDVEVEVFRAPTAEFNARVAAERREGAIMADVFWLTDPPSMRQFEADDLLRTWTPEGVDAVPEQMRTPTSWGTRVLNVVLVHQADHEPAPQSWADLTDPAFTDGVALFDPGFAGSALAALGYFAQADDFGFDHLQALADNGAVVLQAPGEVLAGVAEGRFVVGWTLDKVARDAIDAGSPVELIWPEPGAIAVTSPIGVLAESAAPDAAEQFVEHVLSVEGQQAIASTGWQPVRDDVEWTHQTEPSVTPDYDALFADSEELLAEFRMIFGG